MDLRKAHKEWLLLQTGNDPKAAGELARSVAAGFMESFFLRNRLSPGSIDLLCLMAAHQTPEISRAAVQALYGTIIEGLCDDFSQAGVRACNIALLQIISFVRGKPECRDIASLLRRFGIRDSGSLLARYHRVRRQAPLPSEWRREIRKVAILSRVSAGADVAITSVIVQRLLKSFQEAEIILIGPGHLAEFFAAVPRLRCLQVGYERQGSLCSRLDGWRLAVELLDREGSVLDPGELLVFDPDSRLSQLGLLPLTLERQTCYFSSRSDQVPEGNSSLPVLTNSWLDKLLEENERCMPGLFLAPEKLHNAAGFIARLRQAGADRVLVLNLGVGGNQRKRIGGFFEEGLLSAILQSMPSTMIILDTGGDAEEKKRVGELISIMRGRGVPVDYMAEGELSGKEPDFAHGIIGFSGGLGSLGGLISNADGFCGYDSCGQHLASALGTPAVIIFSGAPNPRFLDRWRSPVPTTHTLAVDQPSLSPAAAKVLIDQAADKLHRITGTSKVGS